MEALDFLVTHLVVRRAVELRVGADATNGPISPFILEAIKETKGFIPEVTRLLSENSA